MKFSLSESQAKDLEEMASHLGTTKQGVVRVAIMLLKVAIREHGQGNTIAVASGNKVVKEIVGIFN